MISLGNSKHEHVTGCIDSGETEVYSFINLERKACTDTAYGSVFPAPGPCGSISIHSSMTYLEQGEALGSGSLCSTEMIFLTVVSDGGERNPMPQLSQEPLHIWRQLHQMVFSGNSPSQKGITEILIHVSFFHLFFCY